MPALQKFDPKFTTRAEDKRKRVLANLAAEKAAYRAVDVRDGMRCRAYGTPLSRTGGLKHGAHHHHIRFRSQGGTSTTANLCLLGPLAHARIHAGKLHVSGNADGRLRFEEDGKVWDSWPKGRFEKHARSFQRD